jgi:ribosome-binding ATPase YchF (GTP1/OBG family)
VRDVKRGDKPAVIEDGLLAQIESALEAGRLANTVELTEEEGKVVKQLNLLTTKKFLYGLNKRGGAQNLDESDPEKFKELTDMITQSGAQYAVLDAKIEDDLKDFEGEEKEMMRSELAGEDDGITTLITQAYNLLGLETFFTTGEDETRAWTISKGSTAPIAGTAIHTDFKDKFIRAEVVFWKDLIDSGSYSVARSKGLVRTEGKDYIVKDGDVIEFKI